VAQKYWKTTRRESLLKRRREELDFIFSFARVNFSSMDTLGLEKYREKLKEFLTEGLLSDDISLDYLKGLQAHVRERMQDIKDASSQLLGDIPLWEVTTSLRVSLNPKGGVVGLQPDDLDRFIIKLTPQVGSGESLDDGKALSVLWLTGLVEDLGLQPSRFRVCSKCNNYFYQPTTREKNYCSSQCAGAVRQARYEERKKGKGVVSENKTDQG
jgi:hypothetical protein